MDLNEYQRRAAVFDQVPKGAHKIIVPLLGLAGETGELLSEFKRNIRAEHARDSFPNVESAPDEVFPQVVKEELGDILWYAANVASKYGLALEDIASANLDKLGDRYRGGGEAQQFFDERYPEEQRIPRHFEVIFIESIEERRTRVEVIRRDGKPLGDQLTDNAHVDDGYRFHDVFHLSYATMLGWSPVTRKFMRTKRSSDKVTDEVEDGGRAWVFEESIAAMVFDYAKRNRFFRYLPNIDGRLLRDIKNITAGIEVRARSRREWELAILKGYEIWRDLRTNHGGWVQCDLVYRTMTYRKATAEEISAMQLSRAEYESRIKNTAKRRTRVPKSVRAKT